MAILREINKNGAPRIQAAGWTWLRREPGGLLGLGLASNWLS